MPVTEANRLVAEAQEALEAVDEALLEARAQRVSINERIAQLIEDRKPLARIVSAARGRKGNGHGPSQPE